MKLFVFAVAAIALLTPPLSAQLTVFDVPFEFTVGTTIAPAGHYIVRNTAGSATIQMAGSDSGDRHFLRYIAVHQDGPNGSLEPKLVFHRYGNQYFLAQVWSETKKSGLPPSKTERELRNRNLASVKQVVIAMR